MNPKTLAGISGAVSVLLGAFGAHALKSRVSPEQLDVWKTASTYHFIHTLAVLANPSSTSSRPMSISNKLFFTGMILFSGSLYMLVVTGEKKLGAVTPIGGIILVGGWISLAVENNT